MRAKDLKVGSVYRAKVNNRIVDVRLDQISKIDSIYGRLQSRFHVTNLSTGRTTVFRSAIKFLSKAAKATNGQSHQAGSRTSVGEVAEPRGDSRRVQPGVDPGRSGVSGVADDLASHLQPGKAEVKAPHVIVKSLAGTGKTWTLIGGIKRIKGIEVEHTPSPQQAAVWESMLLSADAASICFVAFNKPIADELKSKVPAGCDAMTMHSMGFRAVTAQFGRKIQVASYRVQDVISELLERDIRELRRYDMELLMATEKLVGLCKQNLANPTEEELDRIASYYDVDLNGSRNRVFDLVPRVLDRCKDVLHDGRIDFNDMIWIPVILDLPMFRYDLLLIDESQDLNRCQQALARKAGRRLILVGDPNQSIYGFAGADSESMPRMFRELSATEEGCIELPLTVTRRCGKAIVEEARKIVPEFEAHESNGPGLVSTASYEPVQVPCECCLNDFDTEGKPTLNEAGNVCDKCKGTGSVTTSYVDRVEDGNMILCRVNAPLVSQCFRFLKAGRKANIQGRDVGAGLIKTIEKMKCESIVDLVSKLSDWLHSETRKEQAKRNPSEGKLIALQDRFDCLMAFTEGCETVNQVRQKIEEVFTDDPNVKGIRLSSIHKAKGLEADRVFLLQIKGGSVPHPMAKSEWQREQEDHLLYVARTRAIKELVYVS